LDTLLGFNPQLCDTICLPTGVHCGITIKRDALADPDGQAWTGACPQTRGVDSWITQTCWAETPNWCDPLFFDYAEQCGDFPIPVRARINLLEGTPEIVQAYECTDKAVKIHISQWQTLVDTIGPIFDFCYPVSTLYDLIENDFNNNNDECNIVGPWDQEDIEAAIRNGEQYRTANAWEYCNPTTYRVGSHGLTYLYLLFE